MTGKTRSPSSCVSRRLFLALLVLVVPTAGARAQGFSEPFSSPTLDPAWLGQ